MSGRGRLRRVALLAGLVTMLTAGAALADAAPAPSVEATAEPVAGPPASPAVPPAIDAAPRAWLAQPAPPKAALPPPPAPFPWRASLLVLVVVTLGGAAMYVRRSKHVVGKVPQSNRLRIMSSVRVGPKGFLVLAGVGDRAILLGVTDDSVRRIAWMDNEVSASEEKAAPAEPAAPTPPFRDFLRGLRASADGASKKSEREPGPAVELASESRDVVEWSPSAAKKDAPARALATARTEPLLATSALSLEQQAAGI